MQENLADSDPFQKIVYHFKQTFPLNNHLNIHNICTFIDNYLIFSKREVGWIRYRGRFPQIS